MYGTRLKTVSLPLAGLLLLFSAFPCFAESEEKAMIRELSIMNERLETELIDRDNRLTIVSRELMIVSNELKILKSESTELKMSLETMKNENQLLKNWWTSQENYENELKNSLKNKEIENTILYIVGGISLTCNILQAVVK